MLGFFDPFPCLSHTYASYHNGCTVYCHLLFGTLITYLAGLPDPEDGHACDDGVGVVLGGRVDGVVGADDEDEVGVVEVVVDLVHLQYDIIGDTSLGQEDVKLARHAACHRVDTKPEKIFM